MPATTKIGGFSTVFALLALGCTGQGNTPTSKTRESAKQEGRQTSTPESPVVMEQGSGALSSKPVTIRGAGATFPFPLYSRWAKNYEAKTGTRLVYQSIGSGGGIVQIKAKTADFGASDAPMEARQLDEFGLIQFPMIVGGVVPIVNLEGVEAGALRLTPELLSAIYLGRIKRWDDPAIRKENPGLSLPQKTVTVVYRADASGTTWIFTNYLDKISSDWRKEIGNAKIVRWPTGIGVKGNEGLASHVRQTAGAIGYVEFTYALKNKMSHVRLRNRSGLFVAPAIASFQAAAANAKWKDTPGFYVVLTDQPGKTSWPITGASFILMHKEQAHPALAKALLAFFDWCYENGSEAAKSLHYVPVPDVVVDQVRDLWRRTVKSGGKPVWRSEGK